jgi:hypothetical protein
MKIPDEYKCTEKIAANDSTGDTERRYNVLFKIQTNCYKKNSPISTQ